MVISQYTFISFQPWPSFKIKMIKNVYIFFWFFQRTQQVKSYCWPGLVCEISHLSLCCWLVSNCFIWLSRWGWRAHRRLDDIITLLALCEGNPLVTSGFPSQRASNMELWCFLCFLAWTSCCIGRFYPELLFLLVYHWLVSCQFYWVSHVLYITSSMILHLLVNPISFIW